MAPSIGIVYPFTVSEIGCRCDPNTGMSSTSRRRDQKYYIPHIKKHYAATWPTVSYLYHQPLQQLSVPRPLSSFPSPPDFHVCAGDPVDFALRLAASETARTGEVVRVPFVCAANEKRPGGDWETGVDNYPIPCEGGLVSNYVVVFRGLHDRYERLKEDQWDAVPVVSVVPTRWPKLSHGGAKYSFEQERDLVKVKLRAALRICLYNNYRYVEMAELWREVFLYDPDLRGQFVFAAFVFEDEKQSTTRFIQDDIAKKNKSGSGSGSSSKSRSKSSSSSGGGSSASGSASGSGSGSGSAPTDYAIFQSVFDEAEIQAVLSQPDPRYQLDMITS
ncbi:unnamed protein product [Parascedosporium putredinis]|uniref:Uncharacterized protein n=1 Tax=Parascedosporium putredinis TaxID=1442378 RepID=A0A9P1MC67_9PEZI|nr:unnamed protein product [Parascedosporium putredinis]CAI8000051.1 unnamed protein product [Parascedosporium putredinis]